MEIELVVPRLLDAIDPSPTKRFDHDLVPSNAPVRELFLVDPDPEFALAPVV